MLKYNYLVIGSGLAGLYVAYKASKHGKVALITKSFIRESNSYNAQGGIAAVTDIDDDPQIHKTDTLIAGRGLCEDEAVDILVNEGPLRIKEVIEEGMKFDTENGVLALGLEGGHNKRRILHAGGDSTGKWITEFMISKVSSCENINLFENITVLELLTENNTCYGARCWDESEEDTKSKEKELLFYADHTLLATGGASAIYSRTTNPETTIGDGLAIAYNANCKIIDLEFIQFHPSSLYIKNSSKAFLISEAVRGEGAYLFGKDGKRFMPPIHELAELAPRDIVARSIYRQMIKDKLDYVTLSLKHLSKERITKRFPNLCEKCKEYGYDMTDTIPIAPAAHYTVGGVYSDFNGKTDVNRLYVCGEIASTGIMGANRLASNSLIECLVFGKRAIDYSLNDKFITDFPNFSTLYFKNYSLKDDYSEVKNKVASIMNMHAGIVRNGELLEGGLQKLEQLEDEILHSEKWSTSIGPNKGKKEYYKEAALRLLTVAKLIISPAILRKESRGGHYREDFPNSDNEYQLHSVQQKGQPITTCTVG